MLSTKVFSLHAIKDRAKLGKHAAHQVWTGNKKDFKPWVLLRCISELFLLKDNKGIVPSSSPSAGTLDYSLLLCSKTLPIHSILKESLLGCGLLILFPDWFSQPSHVPGIFFLMWSIWVLPRLLAKWPAFTGERPQLPGPHCRDVHWSMAGTAVLSLFTGRQRKEPFWLQKGREGSING